MAITDEPGSDWWYAADITGPADVTGITEPAQTEPARQALRQAVAQLLPSTLDVYLTARRDGRYSSVRITNIPLGTFGISLPDTDGNATMTLWVASNGDQPHAQADEDHLLPLLLSSAIAVHAARRVLGDGVHEFELSEHGRMTWTPDTVRVEEFAGVPAPLGNAREFSWTDPVIGNYVHPHDPAYAAWLWFTDPATGEAEQTAYPLTPTLADMHPHPTMTLQPDSPPEPVPPHPPRLFVPALAARGEWTEPAAEPAPEQAE